MNTPDTARTAPSSAPPRKPLMPLDEALSNLLDRAAAATPLACETVATWDADGRVPVSYTHLTLPTKRIV